MRPQHLIGCTNSDAYPQQIVCLDCDYEWVDCVGLPRSQQARLTKWVGIGFEGSQGNYCENRHAEGSNVETLWNAVAERLRKRGSLWIFAEHAWRVWSLLDLWSLLENGRVNLRGADHRDSGNGARKACKQRNMRAVLECPPFWVELGIAGISGTITLLDVANYGLVPAPLEYTALERVERCSAFVRNMVAVLKSEGLGSLKQTAGMQASFSFKRRHMDTLIQCHNNLSALALEDESYHGGRCEAFRIGRVAGPVYHLDVSAMYPSIAATRDVPISLCGSVNRLATGDQPQLGEGCGIIADVLLDTDEPAYPLRSVDRSITIYPVGRFRTVLAGPELNDALSLDRVVRWYSASWYRMKPALASYSRHVLAMRETYRDDADLLPWIKALGVSLIGKFGQRDRRWVDAHYQGFHPEWGQFWHRAEDGRWNRWRSLANCTQIEQVNSWSYDAVPAIASWVCSSARVRLLNLIRCAGWKEVFYLDTDALMVSRKGYLRLLEAGWIRDGEPGYLRVKCISKEVCIHGFKAYDEEGRYVRAGQPLLGVGAGVNAGRYWQNGTPSSHLRSRQRPEAIRSAIVHTQTGRYEHGLVCADGTVTPHQLWECEE